MLSRSSKIPLLRNVPEVMIGSRNIIFRVFKEYIPHLGADEGTPHRAPSLTARALAQ